MSTATQTPSAPEAAPRSQRRQNALTAGQLPRWVPWAVLAGSILLVGLIFLLVNMGSDEGFGSFNWTGTIVLGFLLFLIALPIISTVVEGRRKGTDRFVTALLTGAFALALLPLVSLIVTVFSKGLKRFLDPMFFTETMRNVVGEGGGALHAIVGTLLITLVAALISVPVGVLTAIYLTEYGRGFMKQGITALVDIMTGIPSIVAGLFAFALLSMITNDPGYRSGFGGAVAMSLLMIPTVVKSTEEMLKLVPRDLREAAYALGTPKWKTIWRIVLPTALAGIVTGVTLAIARVIGETAPLLLVAGFTASMNTNLFKEPMMTLPVYAYNQYVSPGVPVDPYFDRSWAAALTLLIIVMLLNLIARLIAHFFSPKAGRK